MQSGQRTEHKSVALEISCPSEHLLESGAFKALLISTVYLLFYVISIYGANAESALTVLFWCRFFHILSQ